MSAEAPHDGGEPPAAPETPPDGPSDGSSPPSPSPEAPDEPPAAASAPEVEVFDELSPEDAARQRQFRIDGLYSLVPSYNIAGAGSNTATYGNQTINQNFGFSGKPAQLITPLTPGKIKELARHTAPTRSLSRLIELLADDPVVLLRGRPDSGRSTTAYSALLTWAGSSGTPPAMINTSADTNELTGADLSGGRAFLFDASQQPWLSDPAHVLARLQSAAHEAKCRIVVLVTDEYTAGGCVVVHDPPEPLAVLRAWLEHDGIWKAGDLDSHLTELMDLLDGWSLGQARQLAREFAHGLKNREAGDAQVEGIVGAILRAQRQDSRERLREALLQSKTDLGRCFLISGGVLYNLSETQVSKAALRLESLVREQENERRRPGPQIWEPLREWFGYGVRTEPPSAAGDGYRVWLSPEIKAQILQVAWQEAPALRGLLHTWLGELTEDDDEYTATRAAQAVGKLATCDFDAVKAEFLEPWSKSPRSRRLAMAALEVGALDAELHERAHRLLACWASGNQDQRITAAMTYGSQIGVLAIEQALPAFRQIVERYANKQLHALVGRAVAEVYTASTADQVVDEIHRWANSQSLALQRTAAIALRSLAYVPEDLAIRPALIDTGRDAELAALWCNALDWSHSFRIDPRRAPTPPVWDLLTHWAGRTVCWPIIEGIFGTVMVRCPRLGQPLQLQARAWQARGVITTEQRAALRDLLKRGDR
ncbi:hypothetical protein [Nonomuraea sp. NPDC046570]|uniref:hypothetical protein n=1 Tax=Nonomuraea sp. NPDC046570 TaxID=3155255 RepID=UPI0034018AF6